MKLSIWRQTSSNHSNDFHIVGRFHSSEEAKIAADKLKGTLKELKGWYEAHPDAVEPTFENGKYIPTEVERNISAQYGVPWNEHHDWIVDSSSPEKTVLLLEEFVIMDSPNTWAGYDPFADILRKLGGNVLADSEMGDTRICVNMRAVNSDPLKAESLATAINDYLVAEKHYFESQAYVDPGNLRPAAPWLFQGGDFSNEKIEAILAANVQYAEHARKMAPLHELWRQFRTANVPENDERFQQTVSDINALQSQLPLEVTSLHTWYVLAGNAMSPNVHSSSPSVIVDGNQLSIENLSFSFQLGIALTALIRWLRAENCDVAWEFYEAGHQDYGDSEP